MPKQSKFSINNFRKKAEQVEDASVPVWVNSGTQLTIKLYNAIIKRVDEIKADIDSDRKLSVSERQLEKTDIAKIANCHHTNISEKRQADIFDLFNKQNKELSRYWSKKQKKKTSSGKKMTRAELDKENRILKKNLKKLENTNDAAVAKEILKTAFTSEVFGYVDRIQQLEDKIKELRSTNNEQAKSIRSLLKENQALHDTLEGTLDD